MVVRLASPGRLADAAPAELSPVRRHRLFSSFKTKEIIMHLRTRIGSLSLPLLAVSLILLVGVPALCPVHSDIAGQGD